MTAPFDRIVVLDIESSWGRAVKLGFSCQTNEAYVRDPRFKVWGLSWKDLGELADKPTPGTNPVWVRRGGVQAWVDGIDWSRTAVVAQNATFDCSALMWHYGMKPAFIFDTLSMGRALRGVEVGNSLKKLADAFGLPPKGDGLSPSENILDELPFDVEQTLADYCKHDTWLCEQIFLRLRQGYPVKELRLIDMTISMYVNPVLQLDREMLIEALGEEKEKRESLLQRLGVDEKLLASNDELAKLLRAYGVEPPMKKKKATVKTPHPQGLTYAFAKNDAMFQALLNGDNEDVALLLETRLKVKSTTERTRAQRFLDISERGALPVPLSYYGAGTGRWTASKGSAINMQNLKRKSFLRKAIMAPPGYQLVVGDLSQIEPRVLAWLTDYEELLAIFRAGGDPYAVFGAQMFNVPGMTKDSHPDLRQSAKSALLGCGYQLGWANFATQLLTGFLGAPPVRYTKTQAKAIGVTTEYIVRFLDWKDNVERMAEIPHTCTDAELLVHCVAAKMIVDKYRATAAPVKEFWGLCDSLIVRCLAGGEEVVYKCLTFRKEEIVLPNGMSLRYPRLRRQKNPDTKKDEWVYGDDATTLYGGKTVNNCLAKGTQVLTARGWVPIECVEVSDAVYDGVEFVQHGGKVFNGVQGCVIVDAVLMTPNHEVLTHEGWKPALEEPQPIYPDLWGVNRNVPCWQRWQENAVELSVRMRGAGSEAGHGRNQRTASGGLSELWMQNQTANRPQKHYARNVSTSCVYRMAQYGESLHQAVRAGLQKLRCAWDQGVQTVGAVVLNFLARHGGNVCSGTGLGSTGKQWQLHTEKLPMGNATSQQHEQTQHGEACGRTGAKRQHRDWSEHPVQPNTLRMARGGTDTRPLVQQPVWDIVNCGPRQRFVVRGTGGPFIVHNCTQGIARIVMTDGMLRVHPRFPVKGTVHDECIALVPDAEVEEAKPWVLKQMTKEPKYLPGIPLAADGGAHRRYGLAKN